MRLSDTIERFIKAMLTQEEPEVELKRNELAEYFNCAPSQINYVLATRFTVDDGYVIESRRGGGGYIRIVRVVRTGAQKLLYLVNERIGPAITLQEAERILCQLAAEQLLTAQESALLRACLTDQALSVPMPDAMKDALRAKILRSALTQLARCNRDAPCHGPSARSGEPGDTKNAEEAYT